MARLEGTILWKWRVHTVLMAVKLLLTSPKCTFLLHIVITSSYIWRKAPSTLCKLKANVMSLAGSSATLLFTCTYVSIFYWVKRSSKELMLSPKRRPDKRNSCNSHSINTCNNSIVRENPQYYTSPFTVKCMQLPSNAIIQRSRPILVHLDKLKIYADQLKMIMAPLWRISVMCRLWCLLTPERRPRSSKLWHFDLNNDIEYR